MAMMVEVQKLPTTMEAFALSPLLVPLIQMKIPLDTNTILITDRGYNSLITSTPRKAIYIYITNESFLWI